MFSVDRIAYAVPSMIDHYIEVRSYEPPQVFIAAVLSSPLPGSQEYLELARSFSLV